MSNVLLAGDADCREIIFAEPGAVVCVRFLTPEDCRNQGISWRDADPVISVQHPNGEEQLSPMGTIVMLRAEAI